MIERPESALDGAIPRLFRAAVLVVVSWAILALFEVAQRPWAGYDTSHRNVVIAVAGDSPAARAGLRAGDRLLTIDGQAVGVRASLDRGAVGQSRVLRLARGGEELTLTLTYAAAPAAHRVKAWAAVFAGLISMWVCLRAWQQYDTHRTRWLAAVGIGIGLAFLPGPWFASEVLRTTFSLLRSALVLLALLGAWRFILSLPPPADAGRPGVSFWTWVPVSALWVLLAARKLLAPQLGPAAGTLVLVAVGLVFGGYLVATTVVFLRKYIKTPRDQRAELGMRAVLWGSLFGFVPGLLGSFTLLGQWPPATWFFLSVPLAPWSWAVAARRIERSGGA